MQCCKATCMGQLYRVVGLASPPACAESSRSRCCGGSWLVIGLLETLGPRSVIAAFSIERGLTRNEAELALGVHAGVLQGLPTSRSTSKYPGAPEKCKCHAVPRSHPDICRCLMYCKPPLFMSSRSLLRIGVCHQCIMLSQLHHPPEC